MIAMTVIVLQKGFHAKLILCSLMYLGAEFVMLSALQVGACAKAKPWPVPYTEFPRQYKMINLLVLK